jgi:hypothetical protein
VGGHSLGGHPLGGHAAVCDDEVRERAKEKRETNADDDEDAMTIERRL